MKCRRKKILCYKTWSAKIKGKIYSRKNAVIVISICCITGCNSEHDAKKIALLSQHAVPLPVQNLYLA